MAQNIYRGFSTIGLKQCAGVLSKGGLGPSPARTSSTPKISDVQLVTRDLLNAFNIRQGEIPGNPKYGTVIQGFIFEPNVENVRSELEEEVRRVVSQDPRITLSDLQIIPKDNEILIQLMMNYRPFSDEVTVTMGLDRVSGQVSQVG